jgi:predicted GTPase
LKGKFENLKGKFDMRDKLIETLTRLESVAEQYDDVIQNEAADIRQECGVISAEKLREQFAALAEENRLLAIGVIGRVKSGKSSLLNAVFFNGKSVLPKAATPMTASLTILTYGDDFSATVEYFTAQDVDTIRREHDEYDRKWKDTFQEKKKELEERSRKKGEKTASPEIEAKAKRQADSALKEKREFASFDQYERMKKSESRGVKCPSETSQRIDASALSELMEKLNGYVGSDGVFMPYTKSVEIRLCEKALENIQVVDTPGINDPVRSREARTEDYLKKCDVVFIVSPAGQFISSEDMDLMDKLSSKEGVRELYIVASQVDNQLYGSVGEEVGWDLRGAIEKNRNDLAAHVVDALKDLKTNHEEVKNQFDQLIDEGNERVMVTSAICHAMSLRFDERAAWDGDMNHVWGLLRESYPDYFGTDGAARASLDSLANIGAVMEKIDSARRKKDEIIARKEADYLEKQTANIANFKEKLANAVVAKVDRLKNMDMQTVREEKKNLSNAFINGSEAIDGTFDDCVSDFKAKLREVIANGSKALFAEAKNDVSDAEKSETRTRHWTTGWWLWEKDHYENYTVLTIRPGAVKNTLNTLLAELEENLVKSVEDAKKEWRQDVQSQITRALREAVDDVELIDLTMLKNALRRQVNSMELPDFDMNSHEFSSSQSSSGTLEGSRAESFINEVSDYLGNLRRAYTQKTSQFIGDVEKSVKRGKISDMIFKDLRERLEVLEKELGNKQLTLDRLGKCLSAIKEIE